MSIHKLQFQVPDLLYLITVDDGMIVTSHSAKGFESFINDSCQVHWNLQKQVSKSNAWNNPDSLTFRHPAEASTYALVLIMTDPALQICCVYFVTLRVYVIFYFCVRASDTAYIFFT